jgi:hypothetical protein
MCSKLRSGGEECAIRLLHPIRDHFAARFVLGHSGTLSRSISSWSMSDSVSFVPQAFEP